MRPVREKAREPWICSQACYRLCYAARFWQAWLTHQNLLLWFVWTKLSALCHQLRTYENKLDPYQAQQNVRPDLDQFRKMLFWLSIKLFSFYLVLHQQLIFISIKKGSVLQKIVKLPVHGWKFKISKILNFWNSNFKTCRMSTKMDKLKLKWLIMFR